MWLAISGRTDQRSYAGREKREEVELATRSDQCGLDEKNG